MITRTWNLLDSIAFLADAVDIILVKSRCFQIDYSFNDQQGGVIIFFQRASPLLYVMLAYLRNFCVS